MEYLNDEILRELNIKIQDFQFKKSIHTEVAEFLHNKVIFKIIHKLSFLIEHHIRKTNS
jgi:hypothetical protein